MRFAALAAVLAALYCRAVHSDPAGGGGAGFPGGPPPGDHFHGGEHGFGGGPAFPGGIPFPGGPDPASGMPPGFMGQPGFPGGPMPGPGFGHGSPGWGRPVGYRAATRPGRLIVAVVLLVIVVVLIARHSASPSRPTFPSGPCAGGPVNGSTGQSLGNGNYRFRCADGGSTVVHLGGSGN
jgi:hypothetical protein